ncbi:uncharacterized protein SPAPADRAFT_137577 [Spathaspora passalidarum NRRL Y-27907]|uniref:Cell division control 14, SIN component n=1 Tax=Spathaspora passalidarum (strain NRRL Y-27907 / 11-Y1) TaxID=619300 RepID=G3ALZ5_SPAPN|nr:uncharacterized protein SPAPADRAFT_137577 [Spathaspora passalidarum NRRL Y-27907]EGW33349.1 hypothetical protein SPAPADRAFT_137577 [Spathaspora passalidarum NRRL Y-27907]
MESRICDIIDLLDSQNVKDISVGLASLQQLLHNLLPYITTYYNNRTSHHQHNLQHTPTELQKFVALQDSFQYNICEHLVNAYKLPSIGEDNLLQCNNLLQGLVLIHPNSRKLFHRSRNMKTILDLLQASESISIELTISVITTMIHILLKDFTNYRVFEENKGCSILIRRFKLSSFDPTQMNSDSKESNQQKLNFKIIEFLMFYMTDENTVDNPNPKSIQDKASFFKQDFPEIDDLIESLNQLKDL